MCRVTKYSTPRLLDYCGSLVREFEYGQGFEGEIRMSYCKVLSLKYCQKTNGVTGSALLLSLLYS